MQLWKEAINDAKKYQERKKGYGFSSEESQREERVAVYSRLASEINKMEKHLNFHFKS
jgi:uncharacterized protein (DUF2384 family)